MYGTKIVDLGKNYIVRHATISNMTSGFGKNCKVDISDEYSINVI
jgi:hypothetical protein